MRQNMSNRKIKTTEKTIKVIVFVFILASLINQINPVSGKVVKSFDAPNWGSTGIAYDGKYLWLSSWRSDEIFMIDPINENVVKSFSSQSSGSPVGLAWDGNYLWVAGIEAGGFGENGIYKIDPITGKVIKSFSVSGRPADITWDGKYLWVSIEFQGIIKKIDPVDGSISSFYPTILRDSYPRGLAWDGKYLWFGLQRASGLPNRICKIDPISGKIIESFESPSSDLSGLAWDGKYLWLSGDNGKVYRIDPFGVNEAISSAEKAITNSSRNTEGIGVNIEKAKDLLQKAKNALSEGQYVLASDYAEKAKEAASPFMSYEAFFGLIAATVVSLSVVYYKATASRRERKRIENLERERIRREEERKRSEYKKRVSELKAKYEQYKREGYAPNKNLEEMLK